MLKQLQSKVLKHLTEQFPFAMVWLLLISEVTTTLLSGKEVMTTEVLESIPTILTKVVGKQ